MREHDAIEQLAALLDGADAPETPAAVGSLAGLATAVRDHADLTAPTPEFRSSLRAELVAAAEAPPSLVERARDAWTRRTADLRTSARIAVATVTASSMIGSAGVAVAAQEALPGELLYGLKSMTEDARLALAVNGVAEARLHLAFARERLEELRATAGQLDTDEVVALLAEMDAHSEAGAEALLAGVPSGAVDADEVRRFTADQRNGLVSLLDYLPLPAKSVAENSLDLLRRIEFTAANVVPADDCDCGESGLLDTLEANAELPLAPATTPADTTRPGEEPALPVGNCDCIELPRDADVREPKGGEDEPEEPSEPDEEPDEEPFEPTGELTNPEADNDSEHDDSDLDLGASLPTEDTTDTIEETTGADVGTGPADRLQEGIDEAL